MLKSNQEMKFFFWTAFGDSKDFAGLMIDVKTQGLYQGNGAAPAGWAMVSITIINAHKQKGHGTKLICPFLLVLTNLAAALYVEDTDVIHLDMTKGEDAVEALKGLQKSVTYWEQ